MNNIITKQDKKTHHQSDCYGECQQYRYGGRWGGDGGCQGEQEEKKERGREQKEEMEQRDSGLQWDQYEQLDRYGYAPNFTPKPITLLTTPHPQYYPTPNLPSIRIPHSIPQSPTPTIDPHTLTPLIPQMIPMLPIVLSPSLGYYHQYNTENLPGYFQTSGSGVYKGAGTLQQNYNSYQYQQARDMSKISPYPSKIQQYSPKQIQQQIQIQKYQEDSQFERDSNHEQEQEESPYNININMSYFGAKNIGNRYYKGNNNSNSNGNGNSYNNNNNGRYGKSYRYLKDGGTGGNYNANNYKENVKMIIRQNIRKLYVMKSQNKQRKKTLQLLKSLSTLYHHIHTLTPKHPNLPSLTTHLLQIPHSHPLPPTNPSTETPTLHNTLQSVLQQSQSVTLKCSSLQSQLNYDQHLVHQKREIQECLAMIQGKKAEIGEFRRRNREIEGVLGVGLGELRGRVGGVRGRVEGLGERVEGVEGRVRAWRDKGFEVKLKMGRVDRYIKDVQEEIASTNDQIQHIIKQMQNITTDNDSQTSNSLPLPSPPPRPPCKPSPHHLQSLQTHTTTLQSLLTQKHHQLLTEKQTLPIPPYAAHPNYYAQEAELRSQIKLYTERLEEVQCERNFQEELERIDWEILGEVKRVEGLRGRVEEVRGRKGGKEEKEGKEGKEERGQKERIGDSQGEISQTIGSQEEKQQYLSQISVEDKPQGPQKQEKQSKQKYQSIQEQKQQKHEKTIKITQQISTKPQNTKLPPPQDPKPIPTPQQPQQLQQAQPRPPPRTTTPSPAPPPAKPHPKPTPKPNPKKPTNTNTSPNPNHFYVRRQFDRVAFFGTVLFLVAMFVFAMYYSRIKVWYLVHF